jgi:CCR4-NOT transcription complex subunit 6
MNPSTSIKCNVGNAILFRHEKFALKHINFRSRAILLTLQELETNQDLVIANVHLAGSPSAYQERFNQVKSLLKHINKQSHDKLPEEMRVIVCGDFNSDTESGIYRLFSTGKLESSFLNEYSQQPYTKTDYEHPFEFASAYASLHKGKEPMFTYHVKGMQPDTLDYIWFTSKTLQLISVSEPLEDENITYTSLPNATHPSDHLPLTAQFAL